MSAKKGTILKGNGSSSNQFSHPLKKEDMFPKKKRSFRTLKNLRDNLPVDNSQWNEHPYFNVSR